jgi:broad specificity phosphatase PhoE
VLVLVRHAAAVVDPAVPSREWVLSEEGRAAAKALAARLPSSAAALTSDEPKARETAELAGLPARVDQRLGEVERPWIDGDYEAAVGRYLAGEDLRGWERRVDAVARLRAALDDFDGVAVSHGIAIALHAGLSHDEWRRLPFPAVVEVTP